jgi:hypothetical protein
LCGVDVLNEHAKGTNRPLDASSDDLLRAGVVVDDELCVGIEGTPQQDDNCVGFHFWFLFLGSLHGRSAARWCTLQGLNLRFKPFNPDWQNSQ